MEKSAIRIFINTTLLLIGLLFVFQLNGCEGVEPEYEDSITVNLKSGEEYQYSTVSGDEEGAVINIQAGHYERSEIVRNEETNYTAVYYYKPEADYTGKDEVELKIIKYSIGTETTPETEIVKIYFVISN